MVFVGYGVWNFLYGYPVFVASLGFEPRHTEPESAVLPLHNEA